MRDSWRAFPGPAAIPSLMAVVIGFAVSLALLPAYVTEPDELQWPAVAMATGLALVPVLVALRRPEAVLHPTSILLCGIVYWILLDLLQAKYVPSVSNPNSITLSFVAIALFATGICCAGFVRAPKLPRAMAVAAEKSPSARLLFVIGVTAFTLSFLRFAIPSDFSLTTMYQALYVGRWGAPWARGQLGGWDAFLDHMAYFGYVLPAITVLLYRAERRLTWRTIVIAFFSVIICLLIAQGGGRRIVGSLIASAGVAWILTAKRKGLSVALFSLVGVPAILVYLQFILVTRVHGISETAPAPTESTFSEGIAVDDNFYRMSQLIDLIPSRAPHVGVDWIIWILARPIPRVFWPGKPLDAGIDFAGLVGVRDASLTSSIVGESYMAFGFIGCLVVGFVFAYLGRGLARLLDYPGKASAILMYSVGLLALFVGLRSAIEVVLFGYALLAWIILSHVFVKRRPRGESHPKVMRNSRG